MIDLQKLYVGHQIKTVSGAIKTVFEIRKIPRPKLRGLKYALTTQIDYPLKAHDERPYMYESYAENGESLKCNDNDNNIIEIVGLEQVAL